MLFHEDVEQQRRRLGHGGDAGGEARFREYPRVELGHVAAQHLMG